MKLPIYVYEPRDLSVFSTQDDAERAIEAADVKNGIYQPFDAEGRLLTASVYTDSRGIDMCRISDGNDSTAPEELRMIIIDMLEYSGSDRQHLEHCNLDVLVQASLKFASR